MMVDVLNHLARCVYNVTPAGEGTAGWKRWNDEKDMVEAGDRVRLFEVHQSRDVPAEQVTIGASTTDWNVPVDIDICYHKNDAHTAIMVRDYDGIRRSVFSSDTSGLTGFNFVRFEAMEFMAGQMEDSKVRYMRMHLIIRMSVESETTLLTGHISGYGVGYI